MFRKLFSLFSASKRRRSKRGVTRRKSRKSRTYKMRGGWGGAEPLPDFNKSTSQLGMKGGW